MQKALPIIMAVVAYKLTFPQKNFETRLEVKKEAFLTALNILDSQASFYFQNQGAIIQKEEIKDIRSTFSQLLICSDNPDIPKKFAEFFFQSKNIAKSGDIHIKILNAFRNLIRKELGLQELDFKSYPFEKSSYFLYADCAKENKSRDHKPSAKLK
jgi:hypothetical protein